MAGNNPNTYAYVKDVHTWVDVFGLSGILTIFSDSPKGDYIGHAFIKITENGKSRHIGQWPNPGFTKKDIPSIMFSDMGGMLNYNDITHLNSPYLVSRKYELDDNQMKKVKKFIKDFETKNTPNKGYNLRNRQCASFAYGVARAAGIKDIKMWGWVTPQSLSNKIKNLNKNVCK